MGNQNLCLRCMAPMGSGSRCSECGWSDDAVYDIQYIRPGTVLAGRYIMGYYARKNGEGALYAGYDNATQKKVWIREYFPVTIAQRALDTGKISPLAGCGAQYKALMSDFVDICNEIKRLGVTEPVVPIENVFSENNTVYAIYTELELIPFEEFVKREGNTLDYNQALALLLPICNALGILHNHGQIHRGVSPYSIYIDAYNNLYLWDFALSATRTSGSELDAELFSGYTAPEQYSPNGWQGGWTDVYAMGAVFYRVLTGIVPSKSIRIGKDRPVKPVKDIKPEIPGFLSDTIAEAMAFNTEERIQAMQTFSTRLVEEGISSTAVYDVGRVVRETAPNPGRPARQKKKKSGDFKYVMMGLSAMLVLLAGIMFFVLGRILPPADPVGTSEPETGEEETNTGLPKGTVPRVVGRTYEELISDASFQGLFTFSKKEDYSDKQDAGVIYDQAPAEGTPVMGHATVVVYVSKGATRVKVPDIVGRKLEDALDILRGVDILNYNAVPRYDATAEPGIVLSVIPDVGEDFDPKQDSLMIFYAQERVVSDAMPRPESSGGGNTPDDDDTRWNNPDINLPEDDDNGTYFR